MNALRFDIEIIATEESVAVVFEVPKQTHQGAVARVVSGLIHAFAVTESRTLDEMESVLATMITLTRKTTGTEIRLKRDCSDASYLSRFSRAIGGTTLITH